MSIKPKYIHLTEADTHDSKYAELRPIKALHEAKKAYVQHFADCKTTIYLQNPHTGELQALWVYIKPDYNTCCNTVYLLPYQKRTHGKAEPLYYFAVNYWERDTLIKWLQSFDLQVYYAAGVGTDFYRVDKCLQN